MSEKMQCSYCGQEMIKNAIGEHYNYRDCASYLRAELAALREQVRWIPVKERLPGRDGFYLVLENTNQVAGYYHWCKQFGWNDGGRINIQSVTHWMHLPQPPEGE